MPGTAVYTTIYPGVEPFLADWCRSVRAQSDSDFDLWYGADQLAPSEVVNFADLPVGIWVRSMPRDTPAHLRHRALSQIVERYDLVILVDADDVLCPNRVESAKRSLEHADVTGCGLRLIDAEGVDLGENFGPPPDADLSELLPRYNVFGLSNSAYRCPVLKACLPLPRYCVLIDWLLATRAWGLNVRLHFASEPHMLYRQHPANVAPVAGPFSAEQVRQATIRVLGHYRTMLYGSRPLPVRHFRALKLAGDRALRFFAGIASPGVLDEYAAALNQLPRQYVWWWAVAHPDLEEIWNR